MDSRFQKIALTFKQAINKVAPPAFIALYQQFNLFLQKLNDDKESYTQLENACLQLLAIKQDTLFNEKLLPSKMQYTHDNWKMAFFESYLGWIPDLLPLLNTTIDPIIINFYRQMDTLTQQYWQAVLPVIQHYFGQDHKMRLLFKIWRYQNIHQKYRSAPIFLPPHFDRSIFSIMLDSRLNTGEFSHNLLLAKKNLGNDIEQITAQFSADDYTIAQQQDYPVVITGIHASHYFADLYPLSHAVIPMDSSIAEYRYALLVFILPGKGVESLLRDVPQQATIQNRFAITN